MNPLEMLLIGMLGVFLLASIIAYIQAEEIQNKSEAICKKLGYDGGELASSVTSANRVYCFNDTDLVGKEFLVNMKGE
jgi:hypothetical protein